MVVVEELDRAWGEGVPAGGSKCQAVLRAAGVFACSMEVMANRHGARGYRAMGVRRGEIEALLALVTVGS